MKKIRIISLMGLLSMLFLINGCAKKDDKKNSDNCAALTNAASAAATAYVTNTAEATCNAFVKAVQDLENGCSLIDASTKATYDDFVANANCSGQ